MSEDPKKMEVKRAREERLKPLRDRLAPQNVGVTHPCGWDEIVLRLNRELAKTDPGYVLLQTKEKFGTLRFYTVALTTEGHDAVDLAEAESARTCESCGKPGELREDHHWLTTLCDECQERTK